MSLSYVCPRCTGNLDSKESNLFCKQCNLTYPVVDGVPYLAAYGEDWYLKLREMLLYRDFCQKVKSGAIERDRIAAHEGSGAVIFENITRFFDQACSRIDFTKKPKILDVGSGCGEVAQRMAEMGAEAYAVDLNLFDLHHDVRWMAFNMPSHLKFSERLRGSPINPILFRRAIADADYLPFADDSFDYIIMRAVAHHLTNLPRFMAEAARVLKPGGQLLMTSEPLASVLDDPEEYHRGDLDYEEGMNETRPYFHKYHRALKSAGFRDLEVQAYYISFGHRILRLQQRMKWGFDLNRRLMKRILKEPAIRLLDFTGGCMNLYARKGSRKPNNSRQSIPTDVPARSMAELLAELYDSPQAAAAAVRDFLPQRHHTNVIRLGEMPLDQMIVRGVRPVENIDGRPARYLFTVAVFYVAARRGDEFLRVVYHAGRAAEHEPQPRIFVNGVLQKYDMKQPGWTEMRLPLGGVRSPVIELRVEQPGLLAAQPNAADARDVGLAIERIETTP